MFSTCFHHVLLWVNGSMAEQLPCQEHASEVPATQTEGMQGTPGRAQRIEEVFKEAAPNCDVTGCLQGNIGNWLEVM